MKKKEEFVGFSRHEYNPIIRERSEKLLRELVLKHEPKQILEIGTFIGYSTVCMLESYEDAFVTTLEKDEKNFQDAKENLREYASRVNALNCDAYEFLKENSEKKFDLVFMDGPKGQYIKYLPYLKTMLKTNGILVCDDILLHGLVKFDEKIKHKHRSMVNNLRKFLDEIQTDDDFETTLYEFEDGISVSVKKHKN